MSVGAVKEPHHHPPTLLSQTQIHSITIEGKHTQQKKSNEMEVYIELCDYCALTYYVHQEIRP